MEGLCLSPHLASAAVERGIYRKAEKARMDNNAKHSASHQKIGVTSDRRHECEGLVEGERKVKTEQTYGKFPQLMLAIGIVQMRLWVWLRSIGHELSERKTGLSDEILQEHQSGSRRPSKPKKISAS